ncbi:MAG: YcjF family protein [Granulosicoccus sp.]
MNALPGWRRWLQALIEPDNSPALDTLLNEHRQQLPVLWLMGKTGSGKSSIIQRLTGDSRAEVGNGFEPCTQSAMHYDHPRTAPVLRFLDTRGLGEAGYDPTEDLRMAQHGSHALLIITRVDDPSQDTVIRALQGLKGEREELAILHIHTALHTLNPPDLQRAITYNSQQIAQALDAQVDTVQIDFTEVDDGFENPHVGLAELQKAIVAMVPQLAKVLARNESSSQEETLFLSVRKEVLGYAGASAAADILPAVGLVAVPSLQGKMLHALAGRYGLDWNKRMASEFVAALGTSFLYRYLISLGTRQIAKFIPVYGQSAGAAAAASISFATTYALGRAACLYFYRRNHDKPVDPELLRAAFINAFKEQRP